MKKSFIFNIFILFVISITLRFGSTKKKVSRQILEANRTFELALNYEELPENGEIDIESAKNQNNPRAQHNLGCLYYTQQDFSKARKYFKKAAEQGLEESAYNLGIIYCTGNGAKQDLKKAFKWFEKAPNIAAAQHYLGMMYEDGIGVEQDLEKAVACYEEAILLGRNEAKNNLAECYFNGWGVKKDYKRAFEIYSESAEENNSAAMRKLARMYEQGLGTEADIEKANELYKKAASIGYSHY